jgi:hypothetical protein
MFVYIVSVKGRCHCGPLPWEPRKAGKILAVIAIGFLCLMCAASAADSYGTGRVMVRVTDAESGIPIDGTQVYLDGAYAGTTSPSDGEGTLLITGVSAGTHTLRVAGGGGYRESVETFAVPGEDVVMIGLHRSFLHTLIVNGSTKNAINVVFFPSATTFDCANNTKVNDSYYTDENLFREDVRAVINRTYLDLDAVTDPSEPLPAGYRGRFNFYYYFDPAAMGDAFEGCSGSVPDSYWNDVTFADITIILYPTYYGSYSNASCQPVGCFQSAGTGRGIMKVPSDRTALFFHETGHAIFGLVDTYCGDTWYYENDPYPNLWSSLVGCQSGASAEGRDPVPCRKIGQDSSVTCSGEYWRWDPHPDIMAEAYDGRFGAAATRRIDYVLAGGGS